MAFAAILVGALLIGLFAYSNFYLDDKWLATTPGAAAGSADARSIRRARMRRGIVEATLFFVGAALVTVGFVNLGSGLGYGGF